MCSDYGCILEVYCIYHAWYYIVRMCFNRSYFEQVIGIMINGHGVQPQTLHAKSSRAIAVHYYCNLRAVQKGIHQKLYV